MKNRIGKKEFHMNWGVGIAIVYILFVLGMLTLVFKSRSQKIDLVTENYYQQELAYQEEIDAKQRVEDSGCMPVIQKKSNQYQIQIPGSKGNPIQGSLLAYCPSNKKEDRLISLKPTNDGQWLLDLESLSPSQYILKLHWSKGGEIYAASLPFKK
jgi:hypothetical protein